MEKYIFIISDVINLTCAESKQIHKISEINSFWKITTK
jgi:hypothetical protein